MALLRNLRNMIRVGADIQPVLDRIADSSQVKKSKQLPFRFLSAYQSIADYCNNTFPGLNTSREILSRVGLPLEKALRVSVDNLPKIKGRTMIAIDRSGSMDSPLSANSEVTYYQVAKLLGLLSSLICEESTVMYFTSVDRWSTFEPDEFDKHGYKIQNFSPSASILEAVYDDRANGGTDMSLPFKYILHEKTPIRPFDRIIIFSDNETNSSTDLIQGYADMYREKYNKDFFVHAIDMAGYGTQQFRGPKFNLIAGWSDKVLQFINLAEEGISSLIKTIDNYHTTLTQSSPIITDSEQD